MKPAASQEPGRGRRARLIATLTRAPEARDGDRLPAGVDWVEVRADLAGEPDRETAADLAAALAGGLVYTLRSRAEGGEGSDDPDRRAERLLRAAAAPGRDGESLFRWIDLEADRDLHAVVLDALPPARRILSWHGPPTPAAALEERIAVMTATPAALYKLVAAAGQPGDELAPLLALAAVRRPDILTFASGEAGVWTRLVAPVVYGAENRLAPSR